MAVNMATGVACIIFSLAVIKVARAGEDIYCHGDICKQDRDRFCSSTYKMCRPCTDIIESCGTSEQPLECMSYCTTYIAGIELDKQQESRCPALMAIHNGRLMGDSIEDIFNHGAKITVQCNSGYSIDGSPILECVKGLWISPSGFMPACSPNGTNVWLIVAVIVFVLVAKLECALLVVTNSTYVKAKIREAIPNCVPFWSKTEQCSRTELKQVYEDKICNVNKKGSAGETIYPPEVRPDAGNDVRILIPHTVSPHDEIAAAGNATTAMCNNAIGLSTNVENGLTVKESNASNTMNKDTMGAGDVQLPTQCTGLTVECEQEENRCEGNNKHHDIKLLRKHIDNHNTIRKSTTTNDPCDSQPLLNETGTSVS